MLDVCHANLEKWISDNVYSANVTFAGQTAVTYCLQLSFLMESDVTSSSHSPSANSLNMAPRDC